MNSKSISPMKSALVQLAFGVTIFGIAGFWLFTAVIIPLSLSRAARHWEEIPCVIMSSEISELPIDEGPRRFVPVIHYSYQFNGKHYESDRYYFGVSGGSEARVKSIQRQYPPGSQARAFIDPNNPTEAVLNREIKISWLMVCLVIAMIASGIGVVMNSLGQMREALKPKCYSDL